MKFKHLLYFSFSALIATGLASCGKSSSEKDQNSSDFKAAEDSLSKRIEEVVYNIPSPTEIPYLLQNTGAEFNESLINARTKVDQYATRTDKAALNLGVYAADIGYLSSYDKTQEAIDYLNSAKTLADNMGVIGTFDADVLKKLEANISNKDSLTKILDATMKKTEDFLKDDNRTKLSALVITGSFIEGLYISTGLVKSYPKDLKESERNIVLTDLMRVILQQKKSVSELLKMLSATEQTESVTPIVADLKSLETAYTNLNIEEQIKNNKGSLVLSDKNLIDITNIVDKIRKGITE
ncbi:hypothetical protein SAMN04488109_0053 [Chryseolinea serpens]|uniref:Lipoprotein n=1 Tax=Chryseolinea serpens TaxID=947013 RepID=A0A1M5JH45_9BACT|nr:hypothetical protein [Chryseolinea serpens]SHG39838.1 hypothetical protein SAMN04488109_0053 [Chryseolinea serpens]